MGGGEGASVRQAPPHGYGKGCACVLRPILPASTLHCCHATATATGALDAGALN